MIKKLLFPLFISLISLAAIAQAPPPANKILAAAFSKAKAEKKNVFIIFHASWCGWCRKMDAAINDSSCKKFFNDNYVIGHLVVFETKDKKHLENAGAEELFKKHAPENSGIPFWLVYDASGALIADARMPDGSNTGCPASANEIGYFITVLKKSSGIDDKMAKVIYDRFRRNEPVR